MSTIINLWYVWVTIGAICFVVGYKVNTFIKQPKAIQIESIKKWLVWACIEAEAMWKGGTGKIKILEVYNWFIEKYPAVSQVVSYDTFSGWVDDALEAAKHLMETNETIRQYVER